MSKKRHHFVPKAYLRSFCDNSHRVLVYRKDAPQNPTNQSPDNIAFHKYYYSQPLPNGGCDNDSLEDLFSKLESRWPQLVDRLRQGDNINDPESLGTLLDFMALQRVRVPATRDAVEHMRAEQVISTMRVMDSAGKLPPKPSGRENILDHIKVAIDPHQSLLAMKNLLVGIDRIFNEIGIGALHNKTNTQFLTSDNPVIWFDPSVPETEMRPYVWRPGRPLILLFPITPDCIIYGHSAIRRQFKSSGFGYGDLSDPNKVEAMNRHICQFAYEVVFAQRAGQEAVIREHAGVSPVLQICRLPGAQREIPLCSYVFGARRRKPKWNG